MNSLRITNHLTRHMCVLKTIHFVRENGFGRFCLVYLNNIPVPISSVKYLLSFIYKKPAGLDQLGNWVIRQFYMIGIAKTDCKSFSLMRCPLLTFSIYECSMN